MFEMIFGVVASVIATWFFSRYYYLKGIRSPDIKEVSYRIKEEPPLIENIPELERPEEVFYRVKEEPARIENIPEEVSRAQRRLEEALKDLILFTLREDVKKIEENLNEGVIPEEFEKEFEKINISLSDNATVTKEEKGKWWITDKEKFIVMKEDVAQSLTISRDFKKYEGDEKRIRKIKEEVDKRLKEFFRESVVALLKEEGIIPKPELVEELTQRLMLSEITKEDIERAEKRAKEEREKRRRELINGAKLAHHFKNIEIEGKRISNTEYQITIRPHSTKLGEREE